MNKFVIITKWAKIGGAGPGYIDHFRLESLFSGLTIKPQEQVLAEHNIPAENFDRQIYEAYYAYIHVPNRMPSIFDVATSPDGAVTYSMGAYETDTPAPSRDNSPRDQYLALLNVSAERVSGWHDMDSYVPSFNSLDTLFNTLNV